MGMKGYTGVMSRYAKSILAAVAAGVIAAQVAIADNNVTTSEWVTIALAVLTAVGVYAVKNAPPTDRSTDQ